ncbi:MAG TPA: hypothetical protein VML75_13800 [Kofleriaceae bacterium]|nr:hypothetical protein [Kofleriaceae bacterium]
MADRGHVLVVDDDADTRVFVGGVLSDVPLACGKLIEAADRAMYRDKRERTDPRPRMGLALTGKWGRHDGTVGKP